MGQAENLRSIVEDGIKVSGSNVTEIYRQSLTVTPGATVATNDIIFGGTLYNKYTIGVLPPVSTDFTVDESWYESGNGYLSYKDPIKTAGASSRYLSDIRSVKGFKDKVYIKNNAASDVIFQIIITGLKGA